VTSYTPAFPCADIATQPTRGATPGVFFRFHKSLDRVGIRMIADFSEQNE